MANARATGWLQAFLERRSPTMFLSGMFTTKPGGIYYGKTIEIDVKRFGEHVAVVVTKLAGPNFNDASLITTKEFEPPEYGEAFATDVDDLVERLLGVDPYADANVAYTAKLIGRLMDYFMEANDMIMRGLELQASQILQTGRLNLIDRDGASKYTLDFAPKATHFPTVTTAWSDDGADPIDDLRALFEVIRGDGKVNPDMLIMGEQALRWALQNQNFQDELDNRRIDTGSIDPRMMNSGATLYGYVWVGSYMAQIWTYPEGYTHPQTGVFTKYIDDDKVIALSSMTRLDRVSAVVPLPLGPDPRVAQLVPGRLIDQQQDMDVTPNLYPTPNGRTIIAELLSRTLLVPVQIDGFGCLDVNP
ncbi:major capsid protein E [Vibrio phage 1.009.O._10N.261.51.C9]|nr:major capsid protein E [Vibrio phage 1.009.O._10N.261.51.C9]